MTEYLSYLFENYWFLVDIAVILLLFFAFITIVPFVVIGIAMIVMWYLDRRQTKKWQK